MNLDSSIKSELMKDFEKLVSEINFKNYRPTSPEFSNALFIGLMYKLLSDFNGESVETENSTEKTETDDIREELDGAKKYLKKFKETSDIQYKQMAIDELRHSGILIKKEKMKMNPDEFNEKIENYELERQHITEQLM